MSDTKAQSKWRVKRFPLLDALSLYSDGKACHLPLQLLQWDEHQGKANMFPYLPMGSATQKEITKPCVGPKLKIETVLELHCFVVQKKYLSSLNLSLLLYFPSLPGIKLSH